MKDVPVWINTNYFRARRQEKTMTSPWAATRDDDEAEPLSDWQILQKVLFNLFMSVAGLIMFVMAICLLPPP